MNKYRLYIDETGTHDYSNRDSIKHRFLGLVGIIIEVKNYEDDIQPKIRELKRLFSDDPDELVVLHRDEIVNKQGPFFRLNDNEFRNIFNKKFIDLITNSTYILCGVVLDKKSHFERYGQAATHPYHYCMNVMLERYILFLEDNGAIGDVMSECRGKEEDGALREVYQHFYVNGTKFISSERIDKRFTSKKIKLRNKSSGVEGLEFADLLVLTSKFFILKTYGEIEKLTDNFSQIIANIIKDKFRKNGNGNIKGFGIKLIK